MKRCILLAVVAIAPAFLLPVAAMADTETESFDTEAAAAAHGWTAFNGRAPIDLNWKESINAGGSLGEGGGIVSRQNTEGAGGYYADTTVGALMHTEDEVSASGRFILQNNNNYNGLGVIGYFDTSAPGDPALGPSMGLWLTDNDASTYRVTAGYNSAGSSDIQLAGLQVLTYGTPYQFDLNTVGTMLNVTVKDAGGNDLFTETLDVTTAFPMNAFGLLSVRQITGTGNEDEKFVEAYIDDVSYFSAPSLTGDLNSDGFVGQDDLNLVLASWGQTVEPGNPADPNNDLFVGQDDLNPVLGGWGQGTPPDASLSAVPEPGSLMLALFAVAGGALFCRRTWLRPDTR